MESTRRSRTAPARVAERPNRSWRRATRYAARGPDAILLAGVVLLGSAVAAASAHAGCNVIPDAAPAYRGVRGSIDRPYLIPDAEHPFTLRPACGSPRFDDLAFDATGDGVVTATDLLVTIVPSAAAAASPPFLVVGNDDCSRFEEPVCWLEELLTCPRAPRCVGGSQVGLTTAQAGGMDTIALTFPDFDFAGPARLIVGRGDRPLSAGQLQAPCAELLRARPDLAVCIDSIVPARPDGCEALAATAALPPLPSLAFAQLVALPGYNDYQAVCLRDAGAGGGVPKCLGKASKVRYAVDPFTGRVEIPIRWAMILRPKGTPDQYYRRAVEASTALEAFSGVDRKIVIPSAAFLQTVPPQGGAFSPAPIFLPSDERPNELTLIGTADKGVSVLRFFPRLLWTHACGGGPNKGQACEPAPVDNVSQVDCPQSTCGDQLPARYYACAGGARAGLPCTRPHQCGASATCAPGATCQTLSGGGSATPCQSDGDCPGGEQCGRGLFELRDRANQNLGTIERAAGFGERGVCASGGSEGDLCGGPLSCSFGLVRCVQYRAAANPEATPTP